MHVRHAWTACRTGDSLRGGGMHGWDVEMHGMLLTAHIRKGARQVAPIGAEFRITDPLETGVGLPREPLCSRL
jgi:hypothetical protein